MVQTEAIRRFLQPLKCQEHEPDCLCLNHALSFRATILNDIMHKIPVLFL